MRPAVVERRDGFQVRKGRTILSKHDKYFDAEDAVLRAWLHKSHDGDEDEAAPTFGGDRGVGLGWGRALLSGERASPTYS